jgi:3'(2'), 5'-bisphosphate nucleotidase
VPVLGIIYDPVNKNMYWGSKDGAFCAHDGATSLPIHTRARSRPGGTALISHTHINPSTEEFLIGDGITERAPFASSIKFCMLAEGKADIYARIGPTMEWDTAAGHAIVVAAGGSVTTPEGTPFLYGKQGFLNGSFVARGR